MILMWNIAITTYLPNLIYFKTQGLFPFIFFYKVPQSIFNALCWEKIAGKFLILLLQFRCVSTLPQAVRDNVIRDEVLYVSYQFSFKKLCQCIRIKQIYHPVVTGVVGRKRNQRSCYVEMI